MPWSVFDHGRDSVLQPIIDNLESASRADVERDRDLLFADPRNYPNVSWEWKGQDDVPWPTRVTVLGRRVIVRYAIISNYPEPAVVSASDLHDHLSSPNG